MKKLLVISLALVVLLCCACGKAVPAPTPEPTATPEPTPSVIEMDCPASDVLDAEVQDFLSSIKSDPPAAAVIYLDGQYPETVVLDLDTVRSLCTALSELTVSSEIMESDATAENYLSFSRDNGESFTVNFLGDNLSSRGSIYTLKDSDAFWTLLRDTCEKSAQTAAENKAAHEAGEFDTFIYQDETKWWMMNCRHSDLENVGVNEDGWQTVRTTLSLTNTGEHIIMSAKMRATYINADGYVVADVPVDLDFNSAPIFLGECREYILDEKVFCPDAGGDGPAAVAVVFSNIYVNAPNEAGH